MDFNSALTAFASAAAVFGAYAPTALAEDLRGRYKRPQDLAKILASANALAEERSCDEGSTISPAKMEMSWAGRASAPPRRVLCYGYGRSWVELRLTKSFDTA